MEWGRVYTSDSGKIINAIINSYGEIEENKMYVSYENDDGSYSVIKCENKHLSNHVFTEDEHLKEIEPTCVSGGIAIRTGRRSCRSRRRRYARRREPWADQAWA